jgi:hypothetical protein
MRPVKLDLKAMTRSEPLTLDRDTAAGYAQAQDTVFTGLARFRARLEGHMTPIVLWPHHFDLSTLWMLDPEMDDHKPHLNFGFAPFTPGQFDQPYLYAYAYPYPDGFVPPAVPAPLRWQRDGWTGLVVTYDDLAETDVTVEDLYRQMFNVLRPLIERS